MSIRNVPLSDALVEVASGVGPKWSEYRVLGATRAGLALAKEPVGKSPERYKLVEPGTIFYNPMRIMIGSIAMVDDRDEPGITSPDYVVFRTRPGVLHHRWFYYWLRSSHGEQFIRSLARGAVRERLLFKRLVRGSVVLPDWESQECTARKLELCQAGCNKVDEAVSVAGDLRAALTREVFGSAESQTWPSVPLESIAEIVGGIQKAPHRAPTKLHYPFLTVRNVQHGFLDLTDTERFEVSPREFERLRLYKGDLLIVEGNGSLQEIGRNALFYENGDWIHQNHVIRVRLGQDSSPEFVSLYLNSAFGRRQMIEKAKTTSGLYTLSVNKVGDLRVPSPDKEVQDAVVAGVRPRLALSGALTEALSTQAAALASMRTSLISSSLSVGLVHAES